jgi:uncharacterized membrane protein YbhN (UPF0104 family)
LLGVLAFLLRPAVLAQAWRNLLMASYPDAEVKWRDAYGAYLVKNGAGVFLPMHGDDVVRVVLMRDRIKGASPAAVAATAGIEVLFDAVLTAILVALSVWLGASVVDWHAVAADPLKPALVLGLVLVAVVSAVVALRKRARDLGDELKQGLAIFKHRGAYTRSVLGWQALDFGLQLAALYCFLVAFGFAAALTSVVLIRTAQRVTVSLPGFLETGSQQAMIVAILNRGAHTAGQAFGFGVGMKVTQTGLSIVLALVAARVMLGPLHLRARLRQRLQPGTHVLAEGGLPQLVRESGDAGGAG